MRRSWSRLHPRSFWPMARRLWGHCCRRPEACRSCSGSSAIRLRRLCRELARPGGNATGFMNFEYSMGGKWLELLKQIAPGVKRVAVLRDPALPSGIGQFAAIQTVAPSLGVEVVPVDVRDASEIERAVAAFARTPNGGLIVTPSALTIGHRELLIALTASHKLPAIYFERFFVKGRRLDLLRTRHRRPVPSRGQLRRSHPQGREAGRPAGAGSDQVRNW